MSIRPDLVFSAEDQHGRVHVVRGVIDGDEPIPVDEQTPGSPYRYKISTRIGEREKWLRFVKPRTYESLDGTTTITSEFFE